MLPADFIRHFVKLIPLLGAKSLAMPERHGVHYEMIMGPLLSRVVFVLNYLSHPSRSFTVMFLSGAPLRYEILKRVKYALSLLRLGKAELLRTVASSRL